jgi:hypothetical protein
MKTQLCGAAGKVGEWAWSHPGGIGVGRWNPCSGCRRFPVFWQEGMDLVCGEAAVGKFPQVVAEIEAKNEALGGDGLADEGEGGEFGEPRGGVDFKDEGFDVLVENEGGPAVVFAIDEAVGVGDLVKAVAASR